MPIEVALPKLGLTMKEGQVVEWKKKEGDHVDKGDILFILESEKVTFEVESNEEGILARIVIPENGMAPVGSVVAYMLKPGEDESALDAVVSTRKQKGPSDPIAKETPKSSQITIKEDGRIRATPIAKKIAQKLNVDLNTLSGSGPGGKITKKDVEAAHDIRRQSLSQSQVSDDIAKDEEERQERTQVPISNMRRAISNRMMASKTETAQTYMSLSIDAGMIVEFRQALLPYIEEKYKVRLTITDIIMKIVGKAIEEHPLLNAQWEESGIVYFKDVHMGMAMALDGGLIVPVIRRINEKGFGQIAMDRTRLVEKGKAKQFLPDDIRGSTFTVSSLGMFGIEQFTANINVPESAILAVGAIIEKPVAIEGQVVVRPMMNLTLSYDHRSIDGADAAKFLRTLKAFLEHPVQVFA